MNRSEAIKKAGLENVEKVENEDVFFTNRVTDGTDDQGMCEFNTSIDCVDYKGEDRTLIMYVLVDEEIVDEVDDLDQIDWEAAIDNATFEII